MFSLLLKDLIFYFYLLLRVDIPYIHVPIYEFIIWANCAFCIWYVSYGLGSYKRDLRGTKINLEYSDKMNELALINISVKFEERIFINNKGTSIRTCVCNARLNMTSLTSVTTVLTSMLYIPTLCAC